MEYLARLVLDEAHAYLNHVGVAQLKLDLIALDLQIRQPVGHILLLDFVGPLQIAQNLALEERQHGLAAPRRRECLLVAQLLLHILSFLDLKLSFVEQVPKILQSQLQLLLELHFGVQTPHQRRLQLLLLHGDLQKQVRAPAQFLVVVYAAFLRGV